MPVHVQAHPGSSSPRTGLVWSVLVATGTVLSAVWLSWGSIRKAAVFDWFSSDLGNMWQSVWNVAHGNSFVFTDTALNANVSRLAAHADYLLVVIAPLARLWDSANLLLVIQASVVALGAWYVWKLGRLWLKHDGLAAAVALAYCLFGPLQFAALWQFHAVTLAPTFLLAMAEAIVARRPAGVIWLWFSLALITKEQVGLIGGLLAMVLCWQMGDRRRGWLMLAVGWWFAIIHFWLIIPANRPPDSPHLFWDYYYHRLGDTPGQKLLALLQPSTWWQQLIQPDIFLSLIYLLVPLALLPILSPWILLAGLAVLPHWLSNVLELRNVFFHNHVLAVPGLMLAMLDSLRRIRRRWPKLPANYVAATVASFAVLGSTLVGLFPWSLTYHSNVYAVDRELPVFVARVQRIPSPATVSYSLGTGQYVRNRRLAFRLPFGVTQAEYIVLYQQIGLTQETKPAQQQRQLFELMRTYFAQSAAFQLEYDSGRGQIYRRVADQIPEPLPREALLYMVKKR